MSSPNSPHTVESGHTPGPWKWTRDKDGYISLSPGVLITDYFTDGTPWGDEIDRANARLIAAAPDLLEALQDCLDRFVEAFPAAAEYEPIKRGYAAIRRTTGEN